MKTIAIAIMASAIAASGFAQSIPETSKPGAPTPVDPRWVQMQEAVLRTQDVHKVEELIKQGVDINAPIGCGTYGALDGAVTTENLAMLTFVLAHGGRPQGRELDEAAFIANPDIALAMVKALLAAGADPNATGNAGPPLVSAAFRDNRDLVALLLSQPRIKVDASSSDGSTALMAAAEHGSQEIVALLMKAGANPHLENRRRETAITLAEQRVATSSAIVAALQN